MRPRVSKSRYGCKRRVGKSGEAVLGLSDKEAAYIELKMLTVGRSVEESVGWFVRAERAAEVHVKEPNGRPICDEIAALAASTPSSRRMADVPVASALAGPRSIGGRLNSAPGHRRERAGRQLRHDDRQPREWLARQDLALPSGNRPNESRQTEVHTAAGRAGAIQIAQVPVVGFVFSPVFSYR